MDRIYNAKKLIEAVDNTLDNRDPEQVNFTVGSTSGLTRSQMDTLLIYSYETINNNGFYKNKLIAPQEPIKGVLIEFGIYY